MENVKEKENEIEKLKGLIKENEKKQKSFDANGKNLIDQMTQEVVQSRAKIEELQKKQFECEALQQQVEQLEDQITKLNLENTDLKKQTPSNQLLSSQIENLKKQVHSISQERDLRTPAYEKMMAEFAQEKKKIEEIVKELEKEKLEADKLRNLNKQYTIDLAKIEMRYKKSQVEAAQDLEQKNQEIKTLQMQLENLQGKVWTLEQELKGSSSDAPQQEVATDDVPPPPPPLASEEELNLAQANALIDAFQKRMDILSLFNDELGIIEDKVEGFLENLSNKELEVLLILFFIESTYYEEYFPKLGQNQKDFVTDILRKVQTFTSEEELISATIGILKDYWFEGFLTENNVKTVEILMKRVRNNAMVDCKKQPYPKDATVFQTNKNNNSKMTLFDELNAKIQKPNLKKFEPHSNAQTEVKKEATVYHRALDKMLKENPNFQNEKYQDEIVEKLNKRRQSLTQKEVDERDPDEWNN